MFNGLLYRSVENLARRLHALLKALAVGNAEHVGDHVERGVEW